MKFNPKEHNCRIFEVRALQDDTKHTCRVSGYAATFEDETVLYRVDNIEYREVVDKKAFTGAEMRDVIMNYNHGGKPVARTKNGTLKLNVDDKGLYIEADLSGTEEGRKLYEEIRGGYIDKMSFMFTVKKMDYDRKTHTRRIKAFNRIFDVAAVDFPAYETTNIAARSWAAAAAAQEQQELRQQQIQKIKILTMIGV